MKTLIFRSSALAEICYNEPMIEDKKSNNKKLKDEPKKLEIEKGKEVEGSALEGEGQLTVDVYEDGENIIVESTVAGAAPDDLDVHITNDSVTIKGKRERGKQIEEKNFFYQECFWGTFSRSIILPYEVDPDKSTATFSKSGLLIIKMPRLDKKKLRKVKVKVD